jgi:eukaryotic-like serine/threonine-protein kinase
LTHTISPNSTVAHYKIVSKIGAGGMGEVYLAQDTKLDRKVAIKFLPLDSASNIAANARLLREAQAAAKLDHPNICTVYEVGEENERSFIVMQFVEGESLEDRVKRGPLEISESLTIATQVAEALAGAHAHGMIHRDIKPSNIMITSRGAAKVMDFGLAKSASSTIEPEAQTQKLLTAPGTIVGTVPYMSPEQVHGQTLDARSDIFSFGVLLYEILTGQQPFAAESPAGTISAILTREPRPLTEYVANCPQELQRIVGQCIAKDREGRYQAMRDVAVDLDNCRSENKSAAQTSPTQIVERRDVVNGQRFPLSRRTIIAAAVLVLLVIVVGLSYRLSRLQPTAGIKSLAVLPLKSVDAADNYLGLGIADAVIQRISQTGGVIVRPTSAVRRYLNEDTDALTAARQLNTDSVLEGTVQRGNNQLRISVNLLRASDGASLWSRNFDLPMTDIFTIEDSVSRQVAASLRLHLDPAQLGRLEKRPTSNPIAYEFYLKGLYNFDRRVLQTKSGFETTVDYFKKAIESDPNFALAHAQLAHTYATIAVFKDPTQHTWAELANEEISRAQALDPNLAETHLARSQMLFSQYGNYQFEPAIREVQLAQQLNPNTGHVELGFVYFHLGLEELSWHELERALEIDPTSQLAKEHMLALYNLNAKYDEWFAAKEKLQITDYIGEIHYLMVKGRLAEAQALIEKVQKTIDEGEITLNANLLAKRALISALEADFHSAEAQIPAILAAHPAKDPLYHHATYDIACIYALEGKTSEAVKWLRETVSMGFASYPLFDRDPFLNRIRESPEFIEFLSERKAQHERFKREFVESAL